MLTRVEEFVRRKLMVVPSRALNPVSPPMSSPSGSLPELCMVRKLWGIHALVFCNFRRQVSGLSICARCFAKKQEDTESFGCEKIKLTPPTAGSFGDLGESGEELMTIWLYAKSGGGKDGGASRRPYQLERLFLEIIPRWLGYIVTRIWLWAGGETNAHLLSLVFTQRFRRYLKTRRN